MSPLKGMALSIGHFTCIGRREHERILSAPSPIQRRMSHPCALCLCQHGTPVPPLQTPAVCSVLFFVQTQSISFPLDVTEETAEEEEILTLQNDSSIIHYIRRTDRTLKIGFCIHKSDLPAQLYCLELSYKYNNNSITKNNSSSPSHPGPCLVFSTAFSSDLLLIICLPSSTRM